MPDFKQIVVGIDFSACSRNALTEAARIAGWNDARLLVTHCIDPVIIEELQEVDDITTDDIVESARRQLDEAVSRNTGSVSRVSSEVVIGHPFHELMRAAKRETGSLLVLGAHGHEKKHQTSGTIASKCVRKVPAPVLLVRREQDHPFRKIVGCTDFSENSIEALKMGTKIALQDGAGLEIVHVHYPPWMQPTAVQYNLTAAPSADYRKQYTALLEDKLDALCQELIQEFPGLQATAHLLERGHAAYAIIDYLEETGADLAVMGTRGRTGLRILLLGTTAERVVNHSHCSVLTVKPSGFQYGG